MIRGVACELDYLGLCRCDSDENIVRISCSNFVYFDAGYSGRLEYGGSTYFRGSWILSLSFVLFLFVDKRSGILCDVSCAITQELVLFCGILRYSQYVERSRLIPARGLVRFFALFVDISRGARTTPAVLRTRT